MTDIVERLRSMGGSNQRIWDVMDEAANEIERLREENKKFLETVQFYADGKNWEFWITTQAEAGYRAWQTLQELK